MTSSFNKYLDLYQNNEFLKNTTNNKGIKSNCDQSSETKNLHVEPSLIIAEGTSFLCEKCNNIFSHEHFLKNHQCIQSEKFHFSEASNKKDLLENNVNEHGVVDIEDKADLIEEKPCPCNVCNQIFPSDYKLKNHPCIHKERKFHMCEVCNKVFTRKGSLDEHYRVVHNDDKPYSCPTCSKKFAYKGHLKIHFRIHTNERPYSCDICNKSFVQRGTLIKHRRTHTKERLYFCGMCNKNFAQKYTLDEHYRTHSSEKSFSCNFCSKSFKRRTTLTKHHALHLKGKIREKKIKEN